MSRTSEAPPPSIRTSPGATSTTLPPISQSQCSQPLANGRRSRSPSGASSAARGARRCAAATGDSESAMAPVVPDPRAGPCQDARPMETSAALAPELDAAIRANCERVLRQNWREGTRKSDGTEFAYTCPSPGHYPWQWYWDSSFTAIAWRHFDPARARRELESLLAAQRFDGFIGHTIFWNTPLTGVRRFTYNVTE